MRFNELYGLQDSKVQDRISQNYKLESSWYSGDRFDFSRSRISKNLKAFSAAVQGKILQAMSSEYALSPARFAKLFGSATAAVQNRCFFLFSIKQQHYFPVDEFVHALFDEATLVGILSRMRKEDLVDTLMGEFARLGRDKLIAQILSEEISLQSPARKLDHDELVRLLDKLGQCASLIGCEISATISGWNTFLAERGVTPTETWRRSFSPDDIPMQFGLVFPELIQQRLVFIVRGATLHNASIVWHPELLKKVVTLRAQRAAILLAKICSKDEPLIEPQEIRFHDTPADLYRKSLVIAAKIFRNDLTPTTTCNWRVAQVRKVSAMLSGRKDDPFEQRRVETVASDVTSHDIVALHTYLETDPLRRFAKFLAITPEEWCVTQRNEFWSLFRADFRTVAETFFKNLPGGRWLCISDLLELWTLTLEREIEAKHGAQASMSLLQHCLQGLFLYTLQADIVVRDGPKSENIFAFRLREEPPTTSKQPLSYNRQKPVMGAHFEVHLAPDLHPEIVLSAHVLFLSKNSHSVVLESTSLLRLIEGGKGSARAVALIEQFFQSPLPKNVLDFVKEQLGDAREVLVGEHFPFIYCSTGEDVKRVTAILGKTVVKIVDDRLVLLRHAPSDAQLKGLRTAHFAVQIEDGYGHTFGRDSADREDNDDKKFGFVENEG